MKTQRPVTVYVSVTGATQRGFHELKLTYGAAFPVCKVWLPEGFTAELLLDLIGEAQHEQAAE
jgi:hypothetical protein